VVSRNLFNFRPQDFVDEDILAFDEKMRVDINTNMAAMKEKASQQTVFKYCTEFRQMVDGRHVRWVASGRRIRPAFQDLWILDDFS
jgi:hypothetical protein